MRKVITCFCFLLFLAKIGVAQSGWIDYKIDDKFSIKIPSQPEKADDYSVVSSGKDSLICAITKIDMQKISGLDSATLAALAPTSDFINSIKDGMHEKMQDYTLSGVRTGKWNGYYAYYVDGENTLEKVKSYSFMILVGHYLYSFGVVMPADQDPQAKDDFFTSLKLN